MLGIFITAGHPDYTKSLQALQILDEEGVDLIELGVPFSEPLADGPTIQNASHIAISQGMNLDKLFDLVAEARSQGFKQAGKGLDNLILFSYFNPLYAFGIERVIAKCKEVGAKGVLIPDLPLEEAEHYVTMFKQAGLTLTLLAAITSTDQRLEQISKHSSPFTYLVSRIGITGTADEVKSLDAQQKQAINDEVLKDVISKIRAAKEGQAIGLGFGIDSAAKVQAAYDIGADMAIIGSKAIKVLEQDSTEDLAQFRSFIQSVNLKQIV